MVAVPSLIADEWADAFGWDAELEATAAADEVAYRQGLDAAADYADWLEAQAMADADDDADDDPGYDPTPDGEPDPPEGGPAAARPASWWITEFEGRMQRAEWSGNAPHYTEARRRREMVAQTYSADALLLPCHGCVGGWHRFDAYTLCDQCQGAGLVPVPVPIVALEQRHSHTEQAA